MSCDGIAALCPIVPCSIISPYVMSICVVISQFMLCDRSAVCCETELRVNVGVLCVCVCACSYSLP